MEWVFFILVIAGLIALTVFLNTKNMESRREITARFNNIPGFTPTQTVLSASGVTALSIDESANLICLLINKRKNEFSYKVIPASEIVSVDLVSKGKSSSQVAGRAIAGAAVGSLFGDAGAFIGSNVAGSKAALDVESISLIITINDIQMPNFPITFNAKGNAISAEAQARKWVAILEIMARRAASQQLQAPVRSDWVIDVDQPRQVEGRNVQPVSPQLPPTNYSTVQTGVCELRSASSPNSYPVRVDQPNFTIGRAVSNDLILQDAKVSRQHAVLRYLGGSWQIEDSNSTGGVFVNDHRVNRAELGNGDYIRIGGNVFIFREG